MELMMRGKRHIIWISCCFLIFVIYINEAHSLRTKSKSKNTTTTRTPKIIKEGGKESFSSENSISSKILQIKTPPKVRKNEIIEIRKPVNSDIIVGKDVPKNAKIVLQCSAPFPIQWIYNGQGTPEISTNTTFIQKKKGNNKNQNQNQDGVFTATASLGLKGKMRETDTGEYICKGIQNPMEFQESISYFIYVPGKSLFTQKKVYQKLRVHEGQKYLRVPCTISHPDVSVTLQKRKEKQKGFIACPSEDDIKFNPKSGFDVALNRRHEKKIPSDATNDGNYICIAEANGTVQMLEFALEIVTPARINSSGDKDIYGGHHYQYNEERIENDSLELESSRRDNFQSDDAWIYGRNEDSCYPTNPCGPNSRCTIIRKTNLPRCECLALFIGRPPNCRPECVLNIDCPISMACQDYHCENPCEDFCATNATCKVSNHNAICSCPPGYSGNPRKHGKCGRTRSPSQHYFPTRPGYPGESLEKGSDNSNSEESVEEQQFYYAQNRFPCSPWPCGPNSDCQPVGENAHCTCASGYAGQPPRCRRPECRRNGDCQDDHACIDNLCENPCSLGKRKCGHPAKCVVANHSPKCVIMGGGSQNQNQGQNQNHQRPPPSNSQFPESPSSTGGGSGSSPSQNPIFPHPSPVGGMMMMRPNYPGSSSMNGGIGISNNPPRPSRPPYDPSTSDSQHNTPCQNSPCGKNAICSFRNSTVGCKCPSQFTGFGSDPYVECKPSNDPCEACGPHSECFVKKNRPAVCSCLPGTVGSPPNCRENLCQKDRDCGDEQHCHRHRCENPCQRANCGQHAICRPIRHMAVCACLNSPDRDPLFGCEAFLEDY